MGVLKNVSRAAKKIKKCFSKTHSVHFNPFWDNHGFVFKAVYGKFFDYILIVNFLTLRNDSLYIINN